MVSSVPPKFIDRLRIFVKAGSGAPGNPAIRGTGGNGGSVFLRASESAQLHKLLDQCPKKRFQAKHGSEVGRLSRRAFGTDGSNLTIDVPVGVTVNFSGQGNSSADSKLEKLGDLDNDGQTILVAKGGSGGSYQNAYIGSPGQAHSIVLDLKLMSDFGLIGFPNAGKSSLLHAVSGVRTKIASYPFTTLRPRIAHITYPDRRRISLTDLPGLADIYAKYDGKTGIIPPLRHTNFLKHVERTSCLLFVLDALGFQKDQYSPYRNPLSITYLILHQLEHWCEGILLEKPMACVINKIDVPGGDEAAEETRQRLVYLDSQESREASQLPPELLPRCAPQFEGIQMISAKERINIEDLKLQMRQWLDAIELRKRGVELSVNG